MITEDFLGDATAYALAAALAQSVAHLALGPNSELPTTREQLIARYLTGSTITAVATTAYAVRHRSASGPHVAVVLWAVLIGSGAATALMHYADAVQERALVAAENRRYSKEDDRGTSPRPAATFPLSLVRRGGAHSA